MIHLYYGDGKGKTSTAVGMAVRGAGSGKKIAFVQFMKGMETGEIKILETIPNVKVIRSQKDFGFFKEMSIEDKLSLLEIHNSLLGEGIDFVEEGGILILDELTHALNFGLIDERQVKEVLHDKKETLEIVVTGRDPKDFLFDEAHYISEIKKIKHPYDDGITARKGIEL